LPKIIVFYLERYRLSTDARALAIAPHFVDNRL
jgi:hypothetical protein